MTLMKISIKRTDFYKFFFFLFVFFLPFQTRKVFLTDYSFYTGSFTEYGTVFLYLSDIFFLLAFLSFAIFNRNILKNGLAEAKIKSGKSAPRRFFVPFLALVGIYFLSSLLHPTYLEIGLFRSFKMAEALLLVFLIFCTFRDKRILITSLFTLILSASFQSIIAIYQFLYQKSVFISPFLHKLTGETILGPDLPGIAKIGEGSEKMIRAYGTFPHPNLLGGFLLLSLFISLYLYLEHKRDYLSSTFLRDHKSINAFNKRIIPIFWIVLFTSQFIAFFLSFSRSAWLGLMIAIFILAVLDLFYIKIVSRETILSGLKHKHRELSISLAILLISLLPNISLIANRTFQDIGGNHARSQSESVLPSNNTFSDRAFFNNVSRETISRYPLLGSGPGTSIFQIQPYLSERNRKINLESWQYQPPHVIYMLSTAETGLIGLALLLCLILYPISKAFREIVSRETILSDKIFKSVFLSIFIAFLFIGLFDHYFLTLQQGQLIFWIVLGILLI